MPPDQRAPLTTGGSEELVTLGKGAGESPVRVVATWASPPNVDVLVMLSESPSEGTAALRIIRHKLEQQRARGAWIFGVTSPREHEGRSTFATQLALVLSESQRARVLLVEACFENPSIAKLLGFAVPEGYGFSTQLVRKMNGSMEPWCVSALGPSLHVLAEEADEVGYPEALHSTQFKNAIEFLSRGYDFVIVDSPAVLGSGDANVVEDAVDSMIIVARSGVTKASDIRATVGQLGDDKALGVVLWDAEPTRQKKRK